MSWTSHSEAGQQSRASTGIIKLMLGVPSKPNLLYSTHAMTRVAWRIAVQCASLRSAPQRQFHTVRHARVFRGELYKGQQPLYTLLTLTDMEQPKAMHLHVTRHLPWNVKQ